MFPDWSRIDCQIATVRHQPMVAEDERLVARYLARSAIWRRAARRARELMDRDETSGYGAVEASRAA